MNATIETNGTAHQTHTQNPQAQPKKLGCRDLTITNVVISLSDEGGNEIALASNGYIGRKFKNGEHAPLIVTVKLVSGVSIMAIRIDETTNQVSAMDPWKVTPDILLYRNQISIGRDQRGTLYVHQANNNIRLVGITDTGECVMWNIAIVSQGGHFFLIRQMMCSEYAYTDGGKPRIPGMETVKKWQKLGKFLENMLCDPAIAAQVTLVPVADYKPVDKDPVDGEVLWYSQRQQMGAIHTPKGDARVHWSHLKTTRPDGLLYLLKGEVVEYTRRVPIQKPGHRETGFDWEAVDVTVRS